jgi:HEAT repeat protein
MRLVRGLAVTLVLGATQIAAREARPDGGEDGPSTDDLLCTFRPFFLDGPGFRTASAQSQEVLWTDWWYANRRDLVKPSYRAGSASEAKGMVAPPNQAARARARDALLLALASKDPLTQSEAALALGRAGDPRDIATLAKIVSDTDIAKTRRLHRLAAIGMGCLPIGDETQAAQARTALVGAVAFSRGRHDQFSYFWADCAYALAMRGDAAAVPDLVSLRKRVIDAKDMQHSIYCEVLGAISYALGVLGGETALPELQEQLEGRKAPDGGYNDTSWSGAQALARVGGPAARRALLGALGDERNFVRAVVIQALGVVGDAKDDDVAKALRETIRSDKDLGCRRMAAISLGRTGHPSAADTLLRLLDEGRSEDRPFAAMGLGFLVRGRPDPKVEDVVTKALAKAHTDELQGSLALACALGGTQAARPRLAEIVDKGGPTAAPAAAFALGMLGAAAPEREVLHAAVAQSGKPLLRREAALALGMLRDRSVVAQLRAIVGGRTSDLDRATAAVCLGRVGDDADIDFVLGVLADRGTSDPLRACVVHALGWLLDRSDLGPLGRVAADVKWDKQIRGVSMSWTGDAMWEIQHLVD